MTGEEEELEERGEEEKRRTIGRERVVRFSARQGRAKQSKARRGRSGGKPVSV